MPDEGTSDGAVVCPRVLVGVSPAQKTRHAALGGKYRIKYPPEAEIVTIDPYLPPANPVFTALIEDDKLQVGTVLVRSPFGTGLYAAIQEAPLVFEQEKVHLMAELCRILGATRVQTSASTLDVDDDRATLKAGGGRMIGRKKVLGVDASAESRLRQQWSGQLELDASYPASEPNLAEARAFMNAHHLHDQQTEYLWRARNGTNPANDLVIKVTYETKTDSNLRLAMKVTIPTVAGEVTGSRTHSTVARVTLDLHASFSATRHS